MVTLASVRRKMDRETDEMSCRKKGNKRERARAEAGLPFCASVSSKETPLKAQQSTEKKKARGETAFPW